MTMLRPYGILFFLLILLIDSDAPGNSKIEEKKPEPEKRDNSSLIRNDDARHMHNKSIGFKRHLAIYGDSDLLIRFPKQIAEGYQLLVTEWWQARYAQKIKEYNPSIRILFYRDAIGVRTDYDDWKSIQKEQNWFLRDHVTNQRIQHKAFGWYLMDISHSGFRDHLCGYLQGKLKEFPVFDGVFLDDVFQKLPESKFRQESDQAPFVLNDPGYEKKYKDSMAALLTQIKAAIGEKKMMINTDGGPDWVLVSDGVMFEGFIHGSWQPPDFTIDTDQWLRQTRRLKELIRTGKPVLVHSGGLGSPSNLESAMLYAFAGYLLYQNEKSSFCFEISPREDGLPSFPARGIDLGKPVQDAVEPESMERILFDQQKPDSIFMRAYERATVYVNPYPFKAEQYPLIPAKGAVIIDQATEKQ
jgi:hypothetical protein